MNQKSAFSLVELSAIILISGIVIGVVMAGSGIYQLNNKKNAVTIACKLITRSFKGSTLKSHAVPTVGMGANGQAIAGVGLVTTGDSEQFVTAFDCGNRGILVSESKEIFRKAKLENDLEVVFWKKDYKILDIK